MPFSSTPYQRIAAAAVTIGIHVVVFFTITSSAGVRPIVDPYGRHEGTEEGPALTFAFFVDEIEHRPANAPAIADSSKPPPLDSAPVTTAESEESQFRSSGESAEEATPGRQQVGLSMIYMAQIQARVERAWLRPIGARREFRCNVVIDQDSHGGVLDVRLGSCSGNAAFRNALVDAVRRASPLPVPPAGMATPARIALAFSDPGR